MSQYFILKDKKAVPCEVMEWARWFDKADRKVTVDAVGDARVSTIFLGLDHSFGSGPPLLFETMVFGGQLDQEQDRCTTWDEAEKMHSAMVERVKAKTP